MRARNHTYTQSCASPLVRVKLKSPDKTKPVLGPILNPVVLPHSTCDLPVIYLPWGGRGSWESDQWGQPPGWGHVRQTMFIGDLQAALERSAQITLQVTGSFSAGAGPQRAQHSQSLGRQ